MLCPPPHGSRSYRKVNIQNASCQMGCREVTGRQNCFFLQESEWSRGYTERNQHPHLPWNCMTHRFLHPSPFPDSCEGLSIYRKARKGCGCLKFLAGRIFRQTSTLLENSSPIFRQHAIPGRKMTAGKLAAPSGTLLDFGAAFLQKFGADFSLFFFFVWLPSSRQKECSNRCSAQIFGAQIFAPIFAQIFAQILAQIFADFPQMFLRHFGALKIGVPESCKNALKISRKICGVPMALPGGGPHSISAFSSRQHVTQSPPGPRTQGEHVSVHRGIFGPKGMLGFTP